MSADRSHRDPAPRATHELRRESTVEARPARRRLTESEKAVRSARMRAWRQIVRDSAACPSCSAQVGEKCRRGDVDRERNHERRDKLVRRWQRQHDLEVEGG